MGPRKCAPIFWAGANTWGNGSTGRCTKRRVTAGDAPGLKFWNSGQVEEGYLWGKYQTCGERYSNSELQSGRPETQMDYGILPAHQFLRWTEIWRPVWGLGGLTCASESVALHLLPNGKGSSLRLLGDRLHPDCTRL